MSMYANVIVVVLWKLMVYLHLEVKSIIHDIAVGYPLYGTLYHTLAPTYVAYIIE